MKEKEKEKEKVKEKAKEKEKKRNSESINSDDVEELQDIKVQLNLAKDA
jgi:hypothetical protein